MKCFGSVDKGSVGYGSRGTGKRSCVDQRPCGALHRSSTRRSVLSISTDVKARGQARAFVRLPLRHVLCTVVIKQRISLLYRIKVTVSGSAPASPQLSERSLSPRNKVFGDPNPFLQKGVWQSARRSLAEPCAERRGCGAFSPTKRGRLAPRKRGRLAPRKRALRGRSALGGMLGITRRVCPFSGGGRTLRRRARLPSRRALRLFAGRFAQGVHSGSRS